MKSIIKNILLKEVVKKSNYLKIYDMKIADAIKRDVEEYYNNGPTSMWQDIEYLSSRYGIDLEYVRFIIFKYIVDQGDDPDDTMPLVDWLYNVPDVKSFIKDSGYYDEFMDITRFDDIKVVGDKMFLVADGWLDFYEWFDDKDLAERILSEDWAELFDTWYGTELEEIFDVLNENGIKILQDYIIENVDYITDIGHREEFEHMIEDDTIDVKNNIENIRGITDKYNLKILIEEGEFDDKSELIGNMRSAYNIAYNTAAEDEIFESLKNELEDFLGSELKWEGSHLVCELTEKNKDILFDFIVEFHQSPLNGYVSYKDMVAYYLNTLVNYVLGTPDTNYYYPDNSKVIEYFNDSLGDYIY